MSNRKQFVTINDKKHYLDEEGDIYVGGHYTYSYQIKALGLEVETEGPSFEDIDPGIYSPHAYIHSVIVKKKESGDWTNAEGRPLDQYTEELLPQWHEEGVLYRLNKGEATNA